jgi:tetratricopeptide (TPR) repeat protein
MPAALGDQQVPRPQEVFISYSRKDKEFVRRLYEALKRRDREAWVDWEDIRPTEDFMQAIYGAIEGADTFIFVLTPDSIASIPCGREIEHAAAQNKRMVPIVAREVNANTVPEALRKLNWIFYRDGDDFEKATDRLISALDTDLTWVHAHTRLLTRAIEWEAKGKNNSFVLRGDDLRSAEQWLAEATTNKEPKPTALQTEYIIASRKAAARRQRITLGALSFGLVVAIALALVAWRQRTEAVAATKRTSEVASRGNVSLARYSKGSGKNAQALAHLAQALRLNPENREAPGFTASMLSQLGWRVPLTGSMRHHAGVYSAQFSPDGQRVVTASFDRTARLWDAASGKSIGEPMKHEAVVYSAQFSPDGQRVVTASHDKTARLWDAATGKPIGEPMRHESAVRSAQFSPDGQRVVTASGDKTARVWDAATMTDKDTREDILLLADLAEATGGVTLETVGQVENLSVLAVEQVITSREEIAAKLSRPPSKLTPLQRVMKWSVSDRRSRTISPFSQVTVPEWLENRIKEGTVEGLRAAIQVDPANVRVTAHLGRRLANQALEQGSDPDEARRTRAEADFLTSRALKLAPDSDEVKKLRDEVVKLLELKTN